MISNLINATLEEDWKTASTLLYEHWRETCPKVFCFNNKAPWENSINEKNIGKIY